VSLIGSGALRWPFFDILRSARLLNGTVPVRLIGFASEEIPPTVSWSGLGRRKWSGLTGRAKFDMFERFAQKRRWTQFNAETAERNKFEDNLAERLGLDPKGRRLGGRLSRIFDN
jgi:hypothetical protein